jgi:uncharacterized protein YjbI with pentapeptide repeats
MSRDALVVGINTYSNLQKLDAPAEDAEAIAQLLTSSGEFRVKRIPEAVTDNIIHVGRKTKVTLNELEEALVQLFLPEGRTIPDTALFYFSGHGLRKNRGIQEGFLATSDVNPDLSNWGLSLQWLRRLLEESPIRQQIIWLDCCYSGELLNFDEANPGEAGKGRDRCFIAGSREFEVSYQDISEPYSVLTKALLQGLDPKRCPDRWVTNYTLIDFLNQQLKSETQRPIFTNFGQEINLTRQWEKAAPVVTVSPNGICPYKGLAYFDCNEEDPKYFYGRDKLTNQLLDRVRQSNFLAILGASGNGKSSVLRAGLLHQLKLGRKLSGSELWQTYIMQPGEHPLQSLALAFVDPNLSPVERAKQLGVAEDLIKKGATGLRRLVQASPSRVVLVIDQFEEAFTLCRDKAERQQFFACILGETSPPSPLLAGEGRNVPAPPSLAGKGVGGLGLCVILAMRADFFGKCLEQDYSGLAQQIQQNLFTVTPMNPEELRQAIVEPAKRVNLEIEPELVEEMLGDVANAPGSLPLLQYTLTELWKQRTDNCLRLNTYAQLGGVMGTLRKRATQVYESFSEAQKGAVRHIFLSLTQLGEGTEDTRRRVLKLDLINERYPEQLIDEVVQKLADEKLIVTSEMTEKIPPTPLNKGGNDPTPLNKGGNDPTPLNKGGNDPTPLNKGGNDPTPLNKGSNHSTPLNKGSNEILVPPLIRGARGDQASGRVAVVDVAHEALIRQWPLLRKWIDENRDILRQKRKIEAAAEEWRERGKSKGYLLQGKQLTDATTFQKKQAGKLTVSVLAQEFIQKSLRYRRNNRLKFVGLGLIVPLGLAVYLGVVAAREIRIRELRATLEAVKGQRNNTQIILVLEDLVKLNASLANIDLSGANLSGANLSGANFSGANLNRANLSGADLNDANLNRANLSGADLNDADLSGADLRSADLRGADLSGADLRSADLRGANFRGVGLRGANLGGAILHDTSLSEANLRGADLSGANFRGADLSYADLGGVNLYGADLGGADLGGADFRGAKNLTPEQVKSAKNWQQATYDDNFRKKLGLKK